MWMLGVFYIDPVGIGRVWAVRKVDRNVLSLGVSRCTQHFKRMGENALHKI